MSEFLNSESPSAMHSSIPYLDSLHKNEDVTFIDEMDPIRKRRKEMLYDKLHRGFVKVCMGVTLVSGLFLGYKVYEYFRYIQPLHQAQTKLAQDELLLEGRSIEDSPDIKLST
ncbi:hypothetical protein P5V15_003373 [Pogonomyrmex californicus]